MSDFTPAPWHDHIDDDGELYVEMGDGHYAYFGDVENTCGTCHANARLTTAAPEMLEAIEAELRYYDIQARVDQGEEGVTQFDADRAGSIAMSLMRAALRKARGDDEQ